MVSQSLLSPEQTAGRHGHVLHYISLKTILCVRLQYHLCFTFCLVEIKMRAGISNCTPDCIFLRLITLINPVEAVSGATQVEKAAV